MPAEIFIVSGFLGAGKTTLIQKLLRETFQNNKVVLIENDFGEISIDAALLKSGGIEVREINSGCICCSLAGNFLQALKEILDRFQPEKLLIEPSGVGKLSDVLTACNHTAIKPLAEIKRKITVVDVKRCKMYAENFGEFFEDQVKKADVVMLSRTDLFPDRTEDACRVIRSLNPGAALFSKPWDQIHADEILAAGANGEADSIPARSAPRFSVTFGKSILKDGEHQVYTPGFEETHHHSTAEEIFDTITIETERIYSTEDLTARMAALTDDTKGFILRVKGILPIDGGYVNLQYLPGDLQITACDTRGGALSIIGQNLAQQEIIRLFNQELKG